MIRRRPLSMEIVGAVCFWAAFFVTWSLLP